MTDPTQPSQPTWPESSWPPPAQQPSSPSPDQPASQAPGYPGGYPGQPPAAPGYPPQPGAPIYVVRKTNTLAIVALILAVVGIAPVGAILGHVARRQIRDTGEDGDGLALAAIIVGWVLTGIWVCVFGMFVVLATTGALVS